MAMKAIVLLAPMGYGFKKSLKFKWDWAVDYEMFDGRQWRKALRHCKDREEARRFIRERKNSPSAYRNLKMKRRLAQTHWEEYHDSFGWNAGSGKC